MHPRSLRLRRGSRKKSNLAAAPGTQHHVGDGVPGKRQPRRQGIAIVHRRRTRDGSFSNAVTWYVNDIQGGNSTVETINANGVYVAPNNLPNPNVVKVIARSTQDSSKSGSSETTINPVHVGISISPTSVSLPLGGTQQFVVSVTGTTDQSYYWTINGETLNANTPWGSMSWNGLFTAPSILPVNSEVTLTAISEADPTKTATAVVTLTASAGGINVKISPDAPQVVFDGSQSVQFRATVAGTTNSGVTWSTDPTVGNITPDGIFTPLSFNCTNVVASTVIHAISLANSGAQATTTVDLVPPAPIITEFSPQAAQVGDVLQMKGSFALGGTDTLLFPGPNGSTITAAAAFTSVSAVSGSVPAGATSGPVAVQQECYSTSHGFGYPAGISNAVKFERIPRLRIRADHKDLSAGESVQLHASLMGDPAPRPIQWAAGISESGVYAAPEPIGTDTFVTLSGCVQSTSACDSIIVRVNPLRIDPEAPSVLSGGSLQLFAISGGGEVWPSWTILAGGGNIGTDGMYRAPTTLEDSGPVLLSATHAGSSSQNSVAVTGSYPGLINRIVDYVGNADASVPTGTMPLSVAVDGTRAYVLSIDTHYYSWIDAYDISDPAHPAWLDSAEALSYDSQVYAYGGFVLEILDQAIAKYAMQNGRLTFEDLYKIPRLAGYSFNRGIFYGIAIDNRGEWGEPSWRTRSISGAGNWCKGI